MNAQDSRLYRDRCHGTGYVDTRFGKLPCLFCSTSGVVSTGQESSEVVSNHQEMSGEQNGATQMRRFIAHNPTMRPPWQGLRELGIVFLGFAQHPEFLDDLFRSASYSNADANGNYTCSDKNGFKQTHRILAISYF